jgi:tetratricopeptide (TPR) repeat protein
MHLVNYLESLELTRKSPVLMEKLGNLNAAVGKPASSIRAYEGALGLDPSPQQRIRLLLRLGDSLTTQGRGAEAAATWRRLLKECPDYPGRSEIADRLRQLDYAQGDQGSNTIKAALRGLEASPATNSTNK